MSDAQPPTSSEPQLDIDQLLEQEDPHFLAQVADLKEEGAVPTDVEIETILADDEDLAGEENITEAELKGLKKFKFKVSQFLAARRLRLRNLFRRLWIEFLIFLKTRPKEFFLFSLSVLKAVLNFCSNQMRNFSYLSGLQKAVVFLVMALVAGALWMVLANLKGIWIPTLNPPILGDLSKKASWVKDYNVASESIEFFKAFPQDLEIFLFKKMVVNLRPTSGHPNPMGAFEIFVQVDSRETAVEFQDRQVELHDKVQRVLESQSHAEAESELGKNRLKGLIKKDLNGVLTQGWVKDVHFKSILLKPQRRVFVFFT